MGLAPLKSNIGYFLFCFHLHAWLSFLLGTLVQPKFIYALVKYCLGVKPRLMVCPCRIMPIPEDIYGAIMGQPIVYICKKPAAMCTSAICFFHPSLRYIFNLPHL